MKSWLKLSMMASGRWQLPLWRHHCQGKSHQDQEFRRCHHQQHHQQHHRWHHRWRRRMGCQAMPQVMRLRHPILLRHRHWCRRHHWDRWQLCPQPRLWEQRLWVTNHSDLWSWRLQMNQELRAERPCHQPGICREASFQELIWMSSVLVAFTMLEGFTAGCQMRSFQSECEKDRTSRLASSTEREQELWMSWSITLDDWSCSVSVPSSENRCYSLEVHPAIA